MGCCSRSGVDNMKDEMWRMGDEDMDKDTRREVSVW